MSTKKPRVTERRKADANHEVLQIVGGDFRYAKVPCPECPWRTDVPTGVFPPEAFRISAHTSYDMAQSTFACHMAGKEKPATCSGFLNRAHNNMMVRIKMMKGDIQKLPDTDIPLYENYRAMAEANGVDPYDPVLRNCR